MNVLLIPDKFKGSLSAQQVIDALKKGIRNFNASIQFHEVIASDGGDGFLDAIAEDNSIQFIDITTVDPLGRDMKSYYGFNSQTKNAYVELANASGLSLLSDNERNALKTSTYGTGIQIKDALTKGAKTIYIGLGGSATNDAGIGIASALGYRFLTDKKELLAPIGNNLSLISEVVPPEDMYYNDVEFYAVHDVMNPLFGDDGAAKVYAKQKGADQDGVERLDRGLRNLHSVVMNQFGINAAFTAGSGAAGGTAYGLHVFLNAYLIAGAEFILKKSGIYEPLKTDTIDLIITGEGMIDDQTSFGKLVKGVSTIAATCHIPVIAICGKQRLLDTTKEDIGLTDIIEISDTSQPLEYNMTHAFQLIEQSIYHYFKANFNP